MLQSIGKGNGKVVCILAQSIQTLRALALVLDALPRKFPTSDTIKNPPRPGELSCLTEERCVHKFHPQLLQQGRGELCTTWSELNGPAVGHWPSLASGCFCHARHDPVESCRVGQDMEGFQKCWLVYIKDKMTKVPLAIQKLQMHVVLSLFNTLQMLLLNMLEARGSQEGNLHKGCW